MDFETAYKDFLHSHGDRRDGERLRRVEHGLGHAEKLFLEAVWWPMYRHFTHLHPEYEIYDYRDGYRYLDFAFIRGHHRVAIEIDGIGQHWRNITTWQFDDHCQRQNHLVIDGWYCIRLSYNMIQQRPKSCQQTIQQLMGRWLSTAESLDELTVLQRETVRVAIRSIDPVTPKLIAQHLDICTDYAQRLLHRLVERQWLEPASGKVRIRSYELHPSRHGLRW